MLNLLFISNSLRTDIIIKFLQPMLRVKIDFVTDFDNGLKDVFEKRPATIFIQEQIAGITGESVARHIQMLLGDAAPSFILIHEGNAKVKSVKGLFEYLIDLTQPDDKLLEDVLTILKTILGPEWKKIAVSEKKKVKEQAVSFVVPEEKRGDANRLVDDLLSDLGAADGSVLEVPPSSPQPAQPKGQADETLPDESNVSKIDILAEMLVESAQGGKSDVERSDAGPTDKSEAEKPAEPLQSIQQEQTAGPVVGKSRKSPRRSENPEILQTPVMPDTHGPPLADKTPKRPQMPEIHEKPACSAASAAPSRHDDAIPVSASTAIPIPVGSGKKDVIQSAGEAEQNTTIPSPADFIISAGSQETHEPISEELLLAFENNYHSHTNFRKRLAIALFVVGLVTGAWVLLKQKPNRTSAMNTQVKPPLISANEEKKKVEVPGVTPVVAAQKTMSASRQPTGTMPASLPSFVAAGTLDSTFSIKKPGWERYFGKTYESRVFRTGGHIKAVQVLAGTGKSIGSTFMGSALKEITGNSDFSVISKEHKNGFLIERGSVGKKADLVIYRSKTSGTIRAFVVSLN